MYVLRFHNKPQRITCLTIKILVGRLTKWYYKQGGGVFLTETDQKLYHYINRQLEKKIEGKENNVELREEELDPLKYIASTFRSSLLQSIGTREEPKYPSKYDELNVEIVDGEGNKRETFSTKERVIVRIRWVGIEMWEAIQSVVIRVPNKED